MKKRKIIALILGVSIMAASFVGCGEDKHKVETKKMEDYTIIDTVDWIDVPLPSKLFNENGINVQRIPLENYKKKIKKDNYYWFAEFPEEYTYTSGNLECFAHISYINLNRLKANKVKDLKYCSTVEDISNYVKGCMNYIGHRTVFEKREYDENFEYKEIGDTQIIVADIKFIPHETLTSEENSDLKFYLAVFEGKILIKQDKEHAYIIIMGNKTGFVNSDAPEFELEEEKWEIDELNMIKTEETPFSEYKKHRFTDEEILTVFNNAKIDNNKISSLYNISTDRSNTGYIKNLGEYKMQMSAKIKDSAFYIEYRGFCTLPEMYYDVYKDEEKSYDFNENKPLNSFYFNANAVKVDKINKKWVKLSELKEYASGIYNVIEYVYNFDENYQIVIHLQDSYTREGNMKLEKIQNEIENILEDISFQLVKSE